MILTGKETLMVNYRNNTTDILNQDLKKFLSQFAYIGPNSEGLRIHCE